MAAQHLPRDLVRSSSELQELAQTMKKSSFTAATLKFCASFLVRQRRWWLALGISFYSAFANYAESSETLSSRGLLAIGRMGPLGEKFGAAEHGERLWLEQRDRKNASCHKEQRVGQMPEVTRRQWSSMSSKNSLNSFLLNISSHIFAVVIGSTLFSELYLLAFVIVLVSNCCISLCLDLKLAAVLSCYCGNTWFFRR